MTRSGLVALAVAAQVLVLAVVVAPQLSPRLRGDEVRLLVEPVDPIDPFRGAYVDLDYAGATRPATDRDGDVYVRLVPSERSGTLRFGPLSEHRPAGRFLRCRDDGELSCGIESFFASQDEARRLQDELGARGGAVARVKVDGAGRAAIVGIEPR